MHDRLNKTTLTVIAGVICLAILIGLLTVHAWPLWTGQTVYLEMRPVDPRDLFRGDYVILSSPLATLPVRGPNGLPIRGNLARRIRELQRDDIVYVQLETSPSNVPGVPHECKAVSVSDRIEPNTLNLRGRIAYPSFLRADVDGVLHLRYGLDAFFVQEGTGRDIERAIFDPDTHVHAEVALTSGGRVRIRELLIDGRPVSEQPGAE